MGSDRPDLPRGTGPASDRPASGSRVERAGRAGRSAVRRAGSGIARAGRATGRAGRATGRAAAGAGTAAWRSLRRLTHAQGAGESGLARVIELHLVASIADALIVTALANTIFFAVPTEQARGRVATSLLVTMVPFIVLAPVIGPLLDRVRRGRRYALAATMVVRSFLAWVMAGAVGGAGEVEAAFELYPAAFGFLVCQKAYIVTRAAALPRVLPCRTGLVAANSRISLAGVAALGVGGGIGVGLTALAGPSWTLRLAFGVFAAGTVLALALPARIDCDAGEVDARMSSAPPEERRGNALIADLARGGAPDTQPPADKTPRGMEPDDATPDGATPDSTRPGSRAARRRPAWSIGPLVVLGLRANTTVRGFTGFLTLFLAFRLRTEPLAGLSEATSVVLVVVLATIGGGLGNGLGAVLRRIRPEGVVVLVLALTALASAWATVGYGAWAVGAVAFVAGTAQSLGKLCLDALIQREVPEPVRTSAFARSETVLQLAWVIGGGIGLALPLSGPWGLGIAALVTTTMAVVTASTLQRLRRTAPLAVRRTQPTSSR